MRFQVPMPYDVTGTPKGNRKETTEQFWEYVEVDIPVFDDEIAPVALIWQDGLPTDPEIYSMHEKDKWRQLHVYPEDGEQMTRFFDGEHYLRRHDRITPNDLAASFNPQNNYHLLNTGTIHHKSAMMEEHPVAAVPYREDKFFATNYEEKVAVLREKAARFFIVGDDIFERSSEPVIIKVSYRTDGSATTVPRIVPKHRIEDKTHTFRIDRYREVVDSCNEFMKRWKDDTPEVTMEREPEVLYSEAFAYDDTTENLVKAVRSYLARHDDNDRTRLASVEPHYGIAYLNMKLAFARYEETKDLSEVEEWASVLIHNHQDQIQYCNLEASYHEYVDRPVDVLTGAARRMKP